MEAPRVQTGGYYHISCVALYKKIIIYKSIRSFWILTCPQKICGTICSSATVVSETNTKCSLNELCCWVEVTFYVKFQLMLEKCNILLLMICYISNFTVCIKCNKAQVCLVLQWKLFLKCPDVWPRLPCCLMNKAIVVVCCLFEKGSESCYHTFISPTDQRKTSEEKFGIGIKLQKWKNHGQR